MKQIAFILFIFLLSGCREYFEPQPDKLTKPILVKDSLNSKIEYFTPKVATLENRKVLPLNKKLPKDFIAIDENLSKNGNILKVDNKDIKFDELIVTATKKDNLIAVILNNNDFKLYDLNQDKVIFSQNFGDFLALRKFIAKPYFYKDLLLIPTLNGKMVIFDLKQNKVIRSVVISQKDYFNNLIYLNVKNDNLIVASRDEIFVITPEMVVNKPYNIKHILVDDKYVYVFTIEGRVIKLNFALKELKTKEFKYANIIMPVFYNNKIYFLSRGDKSFLISIDKDLKDYKVTPLLQEVEDKECENDALNLKRDVFFSNGVYYIGDNILKLK